MNKPFKSKQEMREDLERRTDPETPLPEVADSIMQSAMLGGIIGVRNGLKILREGYTEDNTEDFPCEEHKQMVHRVMAGMRERIIAFELELLNALIDLAWEVHECTCDHCVATEAQMEVVDKIRKAPYN